MSSELSPRSLTANNSVFQISFAHSNCAPGSRLVISVFLFLQEESLASTRGREEPLNLIKYRNDNIRGVFNAFEAFQVVNDMENNRFDFPTLYYVGSKTSHSLWIFIIIVRGSPTDNLHIIFDWINSLGELGDLPTEYLERLWPKERQLLVDPHASLCPRHLETKSLLSGFLIVLE